MAENIFLMFACFPLTEWLFVLPISTQSLKFSSKENNTHLNTHVQLRTTSLAFVPRFSSVLPVDVHCLLWWNRGHLSLNCRFDFPSPVFKHFFPLCKFPWRSKIHYKCCLWQITTSQRERPCRSESTKETSSKTLSFLATCMERGKYLRECHHRKHLWFRCIITEIPIFIHNWFNCLNYFSQFQ